MSAMGIAIITATALNATTPDGIYWQAAETDAAPAGAESVEAFVLRKVAEDGTPRDGWTGADFTDDIVDQLLLVLNRYHVKGRTCWYCSGLDEDVRDAAGNPDPNVIAEIEFWRLTDEEAYKVELLDEEEPEPGHVTITVKFEFQETRVHDVTTRIQVPEEIANDLHAVRRFLKEDGAWYDELDANDSSALDDDDSDSTISGVRIVNVVRRSKP